MGDENEGGTEVDEHPRVTEPDEESTQEEAAEAPAVATATNDQNRYTLYVPTDHTTLSLGQAGQWIHDTGITGKTDNHFHMFVVGQKSPTDNTMLTLGGPATAHTIDAHVGSLCEAIHGYSMVTSGNAWQDSKGQHVVLSREKDLALVATGEGKTLGIQADAGKVIAFGKEVVAIGSPKAVKIGSHPDLKPETVDYEAPWTASMADNLGAKTVSSLETLGEWVTSAMAFVSTFNPLVKKGLEAKAGWSDYPLASTAKVLADMALFMSSFVRGAMEIGGVEPAGSVGISGQKFVSINAGIGAGMFGTLSAGVVSGGQASILGGVSASVKGLLWTELAGSILTAVSALKDVEIAASKGEIGMSAMKEIAISSQTDAVLITALKAAQMTSDGEAFLYGGKAVYLGSGKDGFGIEIKPGEIVLGKASTADQFTGPGFVSTNQMAIKTDMIELMVGQTKAELKKDAVEIESTKIELKAGGLAVEIAHGKILLG